MNPPTTAPSPMDESRAFRHTPGPWASCSGLAGQRFRIECKGVHNDSDPVATLTGPDRAANARLIAQAPRLLSALKGAQVALRRALQYLPADGEAHYSGEWLDEIAEVIAKATAEK